ncbi:MAG: hypothetical protein ACERKO_13050, partial [Acetanaerobacterium sp.]
MAPYELSESDTYLLQSLGLDKDTNIISFKAPERVKSLEATAYVFGDNGTCNAVGGGQVSLGQDAAPDA